MRGALAAAVLLALTIPAGAQQVSIDRGVRAEGLWCFPLVTNPREYVYIPDESRLATDEQGRPQFSFIRYAMTKPGETESANTISAAAGGGILTLLLLYETPPERVQEAQRALREIVHDDEARIRGPIVFDKGRYALVSSIINPDGGTQRKILASGAAPVLEGNRIALSFDLTPQQASLLLQSFAMATPDVSVVFDMTFSGLTDAYEAELTVDWSEVRKSKAFSAGGTIYFVSADVEMAFDDLLRNNAIRLRSSGSDESMEALLNNVYAKLLELMFRPVEPDRVPEAQRGGLGEALGALIDQRSGILSSRRTTNFGLYAGFQLKEMRSSGISVMDFNHRSTVERHGFIVFNVGDFYQKHGTDERYFRAFNLADPVFQQREVRIGVDGALLPDFDKYINSVTVTVRKQHQSGKETIEEVLIDRESVKDALRGARIIYGWDGDDDRLAWLKYQYRTRWSFKGGGSYETEWVDAEAPMIDVYAPYERRTVQLLGDAEALKERGVRAVIVQVDYPFFGQTRKHQLVARPDQPIEEQQVEIVLPNGQFDYNYAITWHLSTGQRLTASGQDSSGLVFIDEMPEQ